MSAAGPAPVLAPLSAGQAAEAGRLAALAFARDPAMLHVAGPAARPSFLDALFTAMLHAESRWGATVTAASSWAAAGAPILGFSLSHPPRFPGVSLADWLARPGPLAALLRAPGACLRALRLQSANERCRRAEAPARYLKLLAVHPDAQGRGVGNALLQKTLQDASGEGCGVYLETFAPANVEYYQARGFRLLRRVETPALPTFFILLHP